MSQFGLIGRHLGHSFSKKYFEAKFESEGIRKYRYDLYPLERIEDFEELILRVDLKGLNVTVPYKKDVIPFLDSLHPTAEYIGAVNTILFADGEKIGFNTDVIGFRESLLDEWTPGEDTRALVLGDGGAAQAVKYVLDEMAVPYDVVSRRPSLGKLTYDDVNKGLDPSMALIVNTTPLGMYPNVESCPDIAYKDLTERHYLFDLVYNPEQTLFMKKGAAAGARVQNGLNMLIGQAEAAWKIWTE